jgi:hypothetical protein
MSDSIFKVLRRCVCRNAVLLSVLALASGLALATSAQARGREKFCRPDNGAIAADTSAPVNAGFLAKMRETGVTTIIRYYDQPDETLPGKTLRRAERDLILSEGFSIAVVFQHWNKIFSSFTARQGAADGARALQLAQENLQPQGGLIWFGVDGGWGLPHHLQSIEAYLAAAGAVLKPAGYRVGVYGSGRVCRAMLDKGVAERCWLANAKGWPDYRAHHDSGDWVIKQSLPERCGDREVDFNFARAPGVDFGAFGK